MKKIIGIVGAILLYLIVCVVFLGINSFNPINNILGISFGFSFGFGVPEWLSLIIGVLLIVLLFYIGYKVTLKLIKSIAINYHKFLLALLCVAVFGIFLFNKNQEFPPKKEIINAKQEVYYVNKEDKIVKVTYNENKANFEYEFKEQTLNSIQSASGSFYETKNKEWLLANKGDEIFIENKGVIIYRGKEIDKIGSHWFYLGKNIDDKFIKPVKNSYLDLHFNNEGGFGGSGGCNTYSGKFTEHKNSMKISIGEIGSTMAMCPEEIMKQEETFLTLLKKVNKKVYVKDKLHLYFTKTNYLVFKDISDQFKPM